jgi:hypothetical protein
MVRSGDGALHGTGFQLTVAGQSLVAAAGQTMAGGPAGCSNDSSQRHQLSLDQAAEA